MDVIEISKKKELILLTAVIILFIPLCLLPAPTSLFLAVYVALLAILFIPIFLILRKWWVPLIIGLIILSPGPIDRLFFSVQLTPEEGANPYGIVSFIDILMFFSLAAELKKRRSIQNLLNPRIDFVTLSLMAIIFLSICSAVMSYLKFSAFYLPMSLRVIFGSFRFLLVYAWVTTFFTSIKTTKKLSDGILLICIGFILLALLSPKENYEGGNRLSVATYGVNTFGHLLTFTSLMCIPFITYFYKIKNSKMCVLLAACLLICVVFLLLSANRMSSILLLMGIGLYNLFLPGSLIRKLRIGLLILSVFAGGIIIFSILQPDLSVRIFGIFNIVSGENALEDIGELQARFVVWNISLNMFLEHPLLGIGPGQWNYLKHSFGTMPPWMSTILDPHNGYLLYASEMGLITTFIYYSVIIYSIRRGTSAYRLLRNTKLYVTSAEAFLYMSFLLMVVLVVVCWLLSDLTNASGLNIRVQSLMWSLVCLLVISPTLVRKYISALL